MKHIVLTTWGSLGDIHPIIALALELQSRGHRATIATSEFYRAKIEGANVGFHAVRPDLPGEEKIQEITQRAVHSPHATEFLFRELLMPSLRDNYADLSALAPECDIFVTHPAQLAAPVVAEKHALRWASFVLSPMMMFSVCDPSVPPRRSVAPLYRLGKNGARLAFWLMRKHTESWVEEVAVLRRELGLPRGAHPMFHGQFSPQCNLAMYSRELGEPQFDWPQNTVQTGFAFYDQMSDSAFLRKLSPDFDMAAQDEKLQRFLQEGDAPLVFTLGSAAVLTPGKFFRESAQAAKLLQRRAVLVGNTETSLDNSDIVSTVYAPYSQVFPHASTIVHQGGVGTTAQAMRAGKPQLVAPHAHDQPDNANRIARRKIGRALPLQQYHAQRIADELRPLLSNIEYSIQAAKVGACVQQENGAARAADALETLLKNDS